MNEADSSNPKSENTSDYWKSLTPEEFLATMLHELRTPTIVINGYVEILSKEDGKVHLSEALKAMSSSIERINTLCDDIASYTRELTQKP